MCLPHAGATENADMLVIIVAVSIEPLQHIVQNNRAQQLVLLEGFHVSFFIESGNATDLILPLRSQ